MRSLRLRGENVFKRLRSTRHLAILISCLGYSALGVFSDDYLLPSLTLAAQKDIYAHGIINYLWVRVRTALHGSLVFPK